jgi:hypothetical protein
VIKGKRRVKMAERGLKDGRVMWKEGQSPVERDSEEA